MLHYKYTHSRIVTYMRGFTYQEGNHCVPVCMYLHCLDMQGASSNFINMLEMHLSG